MSIAPVSPLAPNEPLVLPQAIAEIMRLAQSLDGSGLWWLSGYSAGLAQSRVPAPQSTPAVNESAAPRERLTVLYGSQTGNAQRVAQALAASFESAALPVRLVRADAYATRELADERYLAVVISTQGDGDPPDDARALIEFLDGRRAPRLPQLRFAVLGLGDSSYPQFCAIAARIDARLAALGATRWIARADADVDLETIATPWRAAVLEQAREVLQVRAPLATVTPIRPMAHATAATRAEPVEATVLCNQRITGRDSDKDIRHIELALPGIRYEPGDALGIWFENPPSLIDAVLDRLGLDADGEVRIGGEQRPLHDWLRSRRELTRLHRPFLVAHAERSASSALRDLLASEDRRAVADLLSSQQVIDLLEAHPALWNAEDLVTALRPLAPRLYSIASSSTEVGEEVHLTVAHLRYGTGDAQRFGAGSHYLATREEGAPVSVFVEANPRFRLPTDPSRDVIMIGPGTGVAPFRGFVQARRNSGASGRNWLFFGNPHARSDFLYQLEWQAALRSGALHRLDLAFSRDQAHKVYVQQRIREQGRAVFDWLEQGAHLYVCGDASRMAKDVHEALLDVIGTHGGHSRDDASDYLNALQQQGRYARDVY